MGVGLRAAARTQINLAVTKVEDETIEAARGLRDVIVPLLWFSEGIDEMDDADLVAQLRMAAVLPEQIREAAYPSFFILGVSLLFLALLLFVKVKQSSVKVDPENEIPMTQVLK